MENVDPLHHLIHFEFGCNVEQCGYLDFSIWINGIPH